MLKVGGNKGWVRRVPAAAVILAPLMEDRIIWSKTSVVFEASPLKKPWAQPKEGLRGLLQYETGGC